VEEAMKFLKWVAIVGIVTVCVMLFLNKDDVRRAMQMRQM
jgi:type IV secretory pathway VirB2 component (pilin)